MVALFAFSVAVPWSLGCALHVPERRIDATVLSPPRTLQDQDGDGLPDALEDSLLRKYSPTALLAGTETAWPASVAWIRARSDLDVTTAEAIGITQPRHRFAHDILSGSHDERDWTMYGHAYPRRGGGIVLQYWLYFPFNKGPMVFFDHESDWEHVSVELDDRLQPEFLDLARHNRNAPGVRVPWSRVPVEDGTHPFYLVAQGSHAAYLHGSEAPFWEHVVDCPRNPDGTPQLDHCPVHPWRAGGTRGRPSPVVNVGERGAPRSDGDPDGFFMGYQGLWGSAAVMSLASAAPPGPPLQPGFCVNAQPGTCR